MRKEKEIVEAKSQFLLNVSAELRDRIFKKIEEEMEQREKEYWENGFIPISKEVLNDIIKTVFRECKGEDILEKYSKLFNEIVTLAFEGLERKLAEFDFSLGFNSEGNFGIGSIEAKLSSTEISLYVQSDLQEDDNIDELKLPNWICIKLKQAKVFKIENLIDNLKKNEIKRIQGLGEKSEQEIKKKLRENGFNIS